MEPEFAVCFPGRLRDELAATGVPVHDLGPVRASRPWRVLRARRRLARLLAAGRYDAVVCQMAWVFGLFGDICRRNGRMVAVHVHGPRSDGWVEWLAGRHRPDLLIAPSQYIADDWQPVFPAVRREVLNNPIPPQVTTRPDLTPAERVALRARFGTAPESVVVLQASRMEAWKGTDLTLRALARLRDIPGWRLWLAGGVQREQEQAFYNNLRRIAAESAIGDRVTFLGQRSDIPVLMRAADIYCQGNRGPEGFSLSFLEASYCGLPVVTTDLGGASEMVDATTGILVPAGEDVAPLAEALRCLIADPDKRSEMGARARQKAIRLCDPRQQLSRLAGFCGAEARGAVAGGESADV
jgi:glycosyltransferase involved in cell wall biosynthesis